MLRENIFLETITNDLKKVEGMPLKKLVEGLKKAAKKHTSYGR